ncbi:MAG: YfhO family protein [Kiritimatiellae bacterium]|nr:YfhO family protein [Kiritimatiellia bacterium]
MQQLMAAGWGDASRSIAAVRFEALVHAAILALLAAAFLWLLLYERLKSAKWRNLAAWIVVAIVTGDAVHLSRHYVRAVPLSFVKENEVVTLLKQRMGYQRAALITQSGFYNMWLTYLFPYHGIPTINITQMPRMPADYEEFLSAVGRLPARFWDLCAVGYILCPSKIYAQMQRDPTLREMVEVVYAYNVAPDGQGGIAVVPSTKEQPGEHVICRFKGPAPRYALIAGWEPAPAAFALQKLQAEYPPVFTKVYVGTETASELPPSTGEGIVGTISVTSYRSGHVRLRVSTEQPAMLRVSEKYDPGWRATIGGKPVTVHRLDYLFFGVFVPAGIHEVALDFAPSKAPLAVQGLGAAACLAAAGWLVVSRRMRKA